MTHEYELTPRWHPYRWFGLDVRRWTSSNPWEYAHWEYGRSQQVAHENLKRLYAPTRPYSYDV